MSFEDSGSLGHCHLDGRHVVRILVGRVSHGDPLVPVDQHVDSVQLEIGIRGRICGHAVHQCEVFGAIGEETRNTVDFLHRGTCS